MKLVKICYDNALMVIDLAKTTVEEMERIKNSEGYEFIGYVENADGQKEEK